MGKIVVNGAQCQCDQGDAPSALTGSGPPVTAGGPPLVLQPDNAPNANVMPFGMCKSPDNPKVKSAGAPVPCEPMVPAPWAPVTTKVIATGKPIVLDSSKLQCQWKGNISVADPGQTKVDAT